MIDPNKIFQAFDSPNPIIDANFALQNDLTSQPEYLIGMYMKIINNSQSGDKILFNILKKIDKSIKIEELEMAGEYFIFNKAYSYLEKLDLKSKKIASTIKKINHSIQLNTTLDMGINYFESCEEYMKCAHILKVKNLLKIS